MIYVKWFILITLAACPPSVSSSKILIVFGVGSQSHTFFFKGIAEALADSGHEVTLLTPFESIHPHPNLSEVSFKNDWNAKMMTSMSFGKSLTDLANAFLTMAANSCFESMEEVNNIIERKYDVVLLSFIFSECYLTVPYKQKIPFIFVMPNTIIGDYSKIMGNVDFMSFTSSRVLNAFHPFTFMERLKNSLFITAHSYLIFRTLETFEVKCVEKGICTPNMPSLGELRQETSLAFINSVRSLEAPARPISPNVVYAGGIHIKETKDLPKDLKQFMDKSGDEGVILFSLGSIVQSSQMKEEHRLIILKVFKSLPNRILWKWDQDKIEDLPHNVMLSKWIPQQDVLGHPKICLFITHGGLFSTQEATWFGVPVVGMPVGGDQFGNMAEIVSQGWGLAIQWDELTVKNLNDTIQKVLHDESIRSEIKHRSKLMRDQLNSPAEQVKYWTEYVIRYNGSKHLQSPIVKMPLYKIYNMDVWAFVILVLFSFAFCLWLILKYVFCLVYKRITRGKKAKNLKTKND